MNHAAIGEHVSDRRWLCMVASFSSVLVAEDMRSQPTGQFARRVVNMTTPDTDIAHLKF